MKKLLLVTAICLFSFKGYSQIYYNEYISFEHQPIEGLVIGADSLNQWQIGKPEKAIFTNALDSNQAIVTDTSNLYIPGIKSVFVLDIVKYLTHDTFPQGWQQVYFHHSMDIDSMAGGYIEITFDSLNWYNIFNQQLLADSFGQGFVCSTYSTPDTLFNNELGFAHNFNNASFEFHFGRLAVKSQQGISDVYNNRPFIRFTFISDSLSIPHDGWMLDGFTLFATIPSSITETLSHSIKIYPNPAEDKLAFEFDENKFKPVTYYITDVLGQQITNGTFEGRFVDVTKLTQGTYFITLADAKGNAAAKMFYKQ